LLRVKESPSVKEAEQEAVVRVRRSDWERVTEREELVGRLSLGSRFPQYLYTFSEVFRGGSNEIFRCEGKRT
jgi:hypothetical protein